MPKKPIWRKRRNSLQQKKAYLIKKFGPYCRYCKIRFSPRDLTLDHIVPIAQGGGDEMENLCLACSPCNEFKGSS